MDSYKYDEYNMTVVTWLKDVVFCRVTRKFKTKLFYRDGTIQVLEGVPKGVKRNGKRPYKAEVNKAIQDAPEVLGMVRRALCPITGEGVSAWQD